MGLLGQRSTPFLADRIFAIVDNDRDELITFHQFATIMDVLCNGTDDERNMFGFALMDQSCNNKIDFEEFFDYFSQVISHWSSLVNTNVRLSRQEMYDIFAQIDTDSSGSISYKEYRRALRKNPNLLDWFDLLNSGKRSGPMRDQVES